MNFDRRLFNIARSHFSAFLLTVLLSLAGGLLVIFWGFVLSKIVSQVFIEKFNLSQVLPLLYLLLAIAAVRMILIWGGETSAAYLAAQIKTRLREMLTEHIQKLGPGFVQSESTGSLTASAIQGVELLDAFYSQYLPQLVIAAFVPIVIVLVVFPIDWLTAIVFILTAPLIPLFMILIGKASEKLTSKQFNALKRMSSFFLDTLQGLTTLKLLNHGDKTLKKISSVSEAYRQTTMSVLRLTFLSALVLEWLATLSVAVVAVEIGIRLLYARMGFEEAFFILIIAPEFYLPLRMLGLRFHASANGVAAAQKIFEVLNQPLPEQAEKKVLSIDEAQTFSAPFNIAFKNVSFSYKGRSLAALDDISFELEAGKHTALVGISGSGKSTIANLILGFLYPEQGQILVNNYDLSSVPLEIWRSQIAWLPQRPFIFNDTIAANIRLSRKDASLEEVRQAADQAYLSDFIGSLPRGLDTRVGEHGAKISGGQAQRIALARVFLRNAPVLIFDEPTSHLDLEIENQLNAAVQRLVKNRTVLTIAHRLSTVSNADQILVLDKGKLMEHGSHRQLVSEGKYYPELVRAYQGDVV